MRICKVLRSSLRRGDSLCHLHILSLWFDSVAQKQLRRAKDLLHLTDHTGHCSTGMWSRISRQPACHSTQHYFSELSQVAQQRPCLIPSWAGLFFSSSGLPAQGVLPPTVGWALLDNPTGQSELAVLQLRLLSGVPLSCKKLTVEAN